MISLNNVNKYYNRGKNNEIHVINDANITLPECGIVAIFGRSGCGKTTLLNAIGGLDNFQSGDISIDGQSIKNNTDDLRNKNVGYIFQNYNLNKNETCLENVKDALRLCGMTDEKEMRKRALVALKNVDMDKYMNRLPNTLSGGQQQRIAIARAIVKNPKIILADEPTGNLDEANTVKVMDLLKAFARDHLVLLVTHEANLVDYYCDTVIELSDGKIVGMRTNSNANGYKIKSDRDIYLGDLAGKTAITSSKANITYYGEAPAVPLEISIVNYKGKTYLKVNSDKVQILDSSSEVQLHEGSFEEAVKIGENSENTVMTELPPVETEGKKMGRLFTFLSSLKSAFKTHFGKVKAGNKVLRVIMVLFSIVLVFMTAVTGTSIKELIHLDRNYGEKVFYLYIDDEEMYNSLMKGVNDGSAHIDYILRTSSAISYGDTEEFKLPSIGSYQFTPFNFESFDVNDVLTYDLDGEYFNAQFYTLSTDFCKDADLIAGKKTLDNKNSLIISKMVADELLEDSPFAFIDSYDDLIGMTCKGKSICGIVDIDEPYAFSDISFSFGETISTDYRIYRASDYGVTLKEGEVVLWTADLVLGTGTLLTLPQKDESIVIAGNSLKVVKVEDKSYSVEKSDPMPIKSEELKKLETQCILLESKSKETWSDEDYEIYYDYWELEEAYEQEYNLWAMRADEYYSQANSYCSANNFGFLLSDEDMIKLTRSVGKSSYCVYEDIWLMDKEEYYYSAYSVLDNTDETVKETIENAFSSTYLMLHSDNVSKTSAFLSELVEGKETFEIEYSYYEYRGDYDSDIEEYNRLITPDDNKKEVLLTSMLSAIGKIIALVVIFVLLSVCIYFVMRSNFFEHIKEVGIYRAIGVSKKNINFRYFVENTFIIGATVFIGYLVTSLVIGGWLAKGAVGAYLYYPLWLALALLVVLYGVCLFCGMLPVWKLLRKTPSQILSKYDI